MAYITGSAANFADMKTAIYNAAVAAGYTLSNDIISKNGCFFKLAATTQNIILSAGTGQSGSTLTGACAQTVKIFQPTNAAANIISFPVSYEIHSFTNPDELYFIIKYNSDFYQQLSFGKSNIPGIGGTGAWFSGSSGGTVSETSANSSAMTGIISNTVWGTGNSAHPSYVAGFPFVYSTSGSTTYNNSFVHTNLDGIGWHINTGTTQGYIVGPHYCSSLLASLPNLYNQATILIPVKCVVARASGGRTIVAQPANIRHCRIDNHVPGEIITFGSEQWKLYPIYRKNNLNRNFGSISTYPKDSGSFGMAVKYQGS